MIDTEEWAEWSGGWGEIMKDPWKHLNKLHVAAISLIMHSRIEGSRWDVENENGVGVDAAEAAFQETLPYYRAVIFKLHASRSAMFYKHLKDSKSKVRKQ